MEPLEQFGTESDYDEEHIEAANMQRFELRQAEFNILRRTGLLGRRRTHQNPSNDPVLWDEAAYEMPWWRRSRALTIAQATVSLVRYPLHTSTMYTQYSGKQSTQNWRVLCRTAPLGSLYQWMAGSHLGVVGLVIRTLVPREATTVPGMVASVGLHYAAFGLLYGAFRQSVVSRLQAASPSGPVLAVADHLRAVIAWIRDRLCLRGPQGSVLSLYLRDVAGNALQAALSMGFTRLLTSPIAVHLYSAILRTKPSKRAIMDDEPEIMFQPHIAPTAVLASKGELLIYTQAIASLLAAVSTRLVFYPVDTVILRLMADEAGLTSFGFKGFFECLSSCSWSSLYDGFATTAVTELSLAWLAAEIAHFMCKSAWAKLF
ncbi:hypothetical protein J3B02_001825 [Coemansia erecta]|uniref:Mitochondrial carrier n=1 Tax=Coemansia asiatica TaxID=1052880 RepID=A0A9W7XIK3_9FUNG|nr:hypothetical protein LPJ64_004695 [Coemansia asiatica]KAJ2856062.1 hypothetical protein J3B02_001825 [Coemansia erecta]KAJ2886464.1 hypothetical protein FB639_001572 [Coemansia asiatica]